MWQVHSQEKCWTFLHFITDQVNKGNAEIECCPTEKMEGDFMSKALQGRKFGGHWVTIMNVPEMPPTASKQARSALKKASSLRPKVKPVKTVAFGEVTHF